MLINPDGRVSDNGLRGDLSSPPWTRRFPTVPNEPPWHPLALADCPLRGADSLGAPAILAPEQAYAAAKARYQTNVKNDIAALEFAARAFDWADTAPGDSVRATVAREGIQVIAGVGAGGESGGAPLLSGMNLAQLARTKTLSALPLLKDMRRNGWRRVLGFAFRFRRQPFLLHILEQRQSAQVWCEPIAQGSSPDSSGPPPDSAPAPTTAD